MSDNNITLRVRRLPLASDNSPLREREAAWRLREAAVGADGRPRFPERVGRGTEPLRHVGEFAPMPEYKTDLAAGLDISSSEDAVIEPKQVMLIKTGLEIEIPPGYEGQVRPRSGLALKYGVTVLNSPGTIDADYRGEVGVILINNGDAPFNIKRGERIAQLVISQVFQANIIEVDNLSETDRGSGGFGSTGK